MWYRYWLPAVTVISAQRKSVHAYVTLEWPYVSFKTALSLLRTRVPLFSTNFRQDTFYPVFRRLFHFNPVVSVLLPNVRQFSNVRTVPLLFVTFIRSLSLVRIFYFHFISHLQDMILFFFFFWKSKIRSTRSLYIYELNSFSLGNFQVCKVVFGSNEHGSRSDRRQHMEKKLISSQCFNEWLGNIVFH